MKVVVPSNPADAKGLMISAIRDDNPVIYIFHKGVMGLPWMAKNPRSVGPVPVEPYETPIGKAAVAREGSRRDGGHPLPIGASRPGRGRADVRRPRSRTGGDRPAQPGPAGPRDDSRLRGKTGRLLIVDEDYQSFGMSGRDRGDRGRDRPRHAAGARAAGRGPRRADPVRRSLERAVLPVPDRILAAARALVGA